MLIPGMFNHIPSLLKHIFDKELKGGIAQCVIDLLRSKTLICEQLSELLLAYLCAGHMLTLLPVSYQTACTFPKLPSLDFSYDSMDRNGTQSQCDSWLPSEPQINQWPAGHRQTIVAPIGLLALQMITVVGWWLLKCDSWSVVAP